MEGLIDGVLPATPETYQQIHQEADRLARLVDDLQELSRVEAGAYALDIRPVSLAAIVATTLKRFSAQSQARDHDSEQTCQPILPAVHARTKPASPGAHQPGRECPALHPEGGNLHFRYVTMGTRSTYSVTDTGIGIPAEHLPHLSPASTGWTNPVPARRAAVQALG